MKWMDPLSVRCKECGAVDHYSVEELKNLSAVCNQCGESLDEVGRNMRKEECRVSAYYKIIMMLLDIEEKLKIDYSDEEIEPVEKLTSEKVIKLAEKKVGDEAGVRDTVLEAVYAIYSDGGFAIDHNCALYQLFLNKMFLSADLGLDADS